MVSSWMLPLKIYPLWLDWNNMACLPTSDGLAPHVFCQNVPKSDNGFILPFAILQAGYYPYIHNMPYHTVIHHKQWVYHGLSISQYEQGWNSTPWSRYKSREYRSRAVREPRKVLKEFGTELSKDVQVPCVLFMLGVHQ